MLRFQKVYKNYSGSLMWEVLCVYIVLLLGNRIFGPRSRGHLKSKRFSFEYPNRGSLYGMFTEIFLDQNYFIEETDKPLTIIDGGANIGFAAIYFLLKAPQAKIISFEPNKDTFSILEKNIKHNNAHVELHNVALGDSNGEVVFYTDENDIESQGSSITKHLESKDRTLRESKVKMEILSEYIHDELDILKLDIEGAEGLVFENLYETGKLQKIKKIFLEYHFDGINTSYPLGKILSMLESSNFIYTIVSPFDFPVTTPPHQIHSYKIVAWQKGME